MRERAKTAASATVEPVKEEPVIDKVESPKLATPVTRAEPTGAPATPPTDDSEVISEKKGSCVGALREFIWGAITSPFKTVGLSVGLISEKKGEDGTLIKEAKAIKQEVTNTFNQAKNCFQKYGLLAGVLVAVCF